MSMDITIRHLESPHGGYMLNKGVIEIEWKHLTDEQKDDIKKLGYTEKVSVEQKQEILKFNKYVLNDDCYFPVICTGEIR